MRQCRACKAEIVFLRTVNGKVMPVDAATVDFGDETYDPERHVSHFETCPEARRFSRDKATPRRRTHTVTTEPQPKLL